MPLTYERESVTDGTHRLAWLADRLIRAIPDGPQVRLVADDQLFVSRQLVRRRPMPGKSPSYSPGTAGYQIYVACRTPAEHAAATGLSQRAVPRSAAPVLWDARTTRLRTNPTGLHSDWTLLNGRGEIVTVRADCGSPRVVDEVNTILAEIEGVLLT
jgi:hypothetical protein